jgi:2-C-methyl-D-erythritol 4-phosphate cytidylyltransferase
VKIGLIITAAGQSSRFGAGDKLLTEYEGKSILQRTYEKFLGFPEVVQTVITCRPGQEKSMPCDAVAGGATRFESVYNGFNFLRNVDVVMIHDAARPAVSRDVIQRVIEASKTFSAVIPAVPVVDTIKWVEGDVVKETLPRDKLVSVQTPQAFHYQVLRLGYETFKGRAVEITDEAMMVERLGESVHVVRGDGENIKITVPTDLRWLKGSL